MAFDRLSRLASIPALGLALVVWLTQAVPAAAMGLLRDPDIEHGLRELAFPVLRAAGLNTNRVRVLLVNDSRLNAFVIDHNTIFINYGLILKVDRPELLQAVIAHEAAHIANGHLSRRTANLQNTQRIATLGTALALIAAAAGGGEGAVGLALGAQSSAFRSFLSHTRAEEASADRAAASYLRWADISPTGLVDLHRLFAGQELLGPSQQDPYARSHPLTRDRIRAAETFVEVHGDNASSNPNADYWFARIKGKISAFTRSPSWTLRRAPEEKTRDIRLMRQAVAYHRTHNLAQARAAIQGALEIRPDDPFYYELKGQILMESRRFQESLDAYKTAVDLAPNDALILAGYGHVLLATDQPKQARDMLEKARARDYRNARMMRDLGLAYSQTGNPGMASVVTAERFALQGRLDDAGIHAKRAIGRLPEGSPGWQRAHDVLLASERVKKRKR